MIEAHRLAPIREGKTRLGVLRRAKRFGGGVELEVEQRLHADEKWRLRGRRCRRRKTDRAQLLRGRRLRPTERAGSHEDDDDEERSMKSCERASAPRVGSLEQWSF